jgi:hypothetical protein
MNAARRESAMKIHRTSRHRAPVALAALLACVAPCHADDSVVAAAPATPEASPLIAADGDMVPPKAPPEQPPGNVVSARALQASGELGEPAVPRAVEVEPPSVPLRWSSSAELVGSAYQLSLTRGRVDVGMSFDTPARAGRPVDPRIDVQGPVMASLPSLRLGLHQSDGRAPPAGSLLARATGQGTGDYASKIGIQWKPAESNVSFIREGLGFRLDSNERITMKLRKGMLGLYMQRNF